MCTRPAGSKIKLMQKVIRQIVGWPDPIPYVTHDLNVLGY
jgi:hypothetical protein